MAQVYTIKLHGPCGDLSVTVKFLSMHPLLRDVSPDHGESNGQEMDNGSVWKFMRSVAREEPTSYPELLCLVPFLLFRKFMSCDILARCVGFQLTSKDQST